MVKSRKYRFENLDIFENLEFHPVKIGVRRFENIVLNVWFSFSDVQAFENLICKYFGKIKHKASVIGLKSQIFKALKV